MGRQHSGSWVNNQQGKKNNEERSRKMFNAQFSICNVQGIRNKAQ
jgi:hypothetical protein